MEPCKLTFSSIAMIMDKFGLFTHTFEDFKEYNPLKLNAIDYILCVKPCFILPCSKKTSEANF